MPPLLTPASRSPSTTHGGRIVESDDGGHVIQTYTSPNGATTVDVNNDPSFLERGRFRLDTFVATADLPFATTWSSGGATW